MRLQQITIELLLPEGQSPYPLGEERPGHDYRALLHFFKDIGYKVFSIESKVRDE